MGVVLPSSSYPSSADFARIISRKFVHGRLLVIGANLQELERQFAEVKRNAVIMRSAGDLMMKPEQAEATARFEVGIWFYPAGDHDDDRMVEAVSHRAASVVLLPGPGADHATPRPPHLQRFQRVGLHPQYESALM
jgi:hypothetical protein